MKIVVKKWYEAARDIILNLTFTKFMVFILGLLLMILPGMIFKIKRQYENKQLGIVFKKHGVYLDEVIVDFKGLEFPEGKLVSIEIIEKDNKHYKLIVYDL